MRYLFAASLLPLALSAQSNTAPLAPVVVTATRVESPVHPPATLAVLSGDSLRARGIVRLSEALRLVPGLSVVTSSSLGSQSSLFLRGGQSNYVRVLLDGVPLNEPGGALDLSSLTLDNIERVEIVRGPASVLYGADAVTGVIQLVSRTGSAAPRAALSLDGGSFGQRDAAASAAVGSDRLGLGVAAADRAAEGILPFNNSYRNQSASASVRMAPGARTTATLSARWLSATYHYPTASDGSIVDHNAENATRRLTLAFSGRHDFGAHVTSAWTLASSEHTPRSNDGPDTPADTTGFYGFYSRGAVTRRSADLRTTVRAGATQAFTLGAEASRDHERSSSLSLSQYGRSAGSFVAARNDRALYVQALGGVFGRGSYQAGARLDDNSAFGVFRTARVGLAWPVAPAWLVRAAAGSAFRAPSFFENFATGYVRGNPALAPERTHSREVALEGRLGAATLRVTGYQQRFRDMIQYTARTVSPLAPNYVNVAGANADGVEGEVDLPLGVASRARLTYAYSRTRVTDAGFDEGAGATFVLGEPLMRRPAQSARAEWSRAFGDRSSVIVGASYTGSTHDRDYSQWPASPVLLPARTLVDLAANLRLTPSSARVPVQARLRGDNLTNVAYEGIFGFRAPGRSVRVGVTIGRP